MKLLGSLASPYVRKVRIVLAEKQIDHQFEVVDVWSSPTAITSTHPLGKVPCLILDDGSTIYDSRVIVEYLDQISPLHRLIPGTGRSRAHVRTWEALCDGLLDAAVLIRVENTQREPAQRSEAWLERQRVKVDAALEVMAEGLGTRPWVCEGQFTLADIGFGCALGWLTFRFPDMDWRSRHPNLGAHLDRLSSRRAFSDTQPR